MLIVVINLRWDGPCLCFLIVVPIFVDKVLMQVVLEGSEYKTIPKSPKMLASGTTKSVRKKKRGALAKEWSLMVVEVREQTYPSRPNTAHD